MSEKNSQQKRPSPYLKFMGMGSQMLVPILLGIWLGKKADEYTGNEKKWSAVGIIVGVFLGMFLVLKNIIQLTKEQDD